MASSSVHCSLISSFELKLHRSLALTPRCDLIWCVQALRAKDLNEMFPVVDAEAAPMEDAPPPLLRRHPGLLTFSFFFFPYPPFLWLRCDVVSCHEWAVVAGWMYDDRPWMSSSSTPMVSPSTQLFPSAFCDARVWPRFHGWLLVVRHVEDRVFELICVVGGHLATDFLLQVRMPTVLCCRWLLNYLVCIPLMSCKLLISCR